MAALINIPCLSAGVALIRSQDIWFVGGAVAGHTALYGSRQRFDTGNVDNGLQCHLVAGIRLPYRLRAQLEFGLARGLDWRGNTNYRDAGERQPSEANRNRLPPDDGRRSRRLSVRCLLGMDFARIGIFIFFAGPLTTEAG